MHAHIALRKVATAAAHFINLLVRLPLAGNPGNAFHPSANTAAVGFRTNGFDLDPVVAGLRIAAYQLRKVVHRIDDHIDIAVIVEVAERASA